MGISDFGQVSRLVSKRFQKGFWAAERLRAQIESCRESLLRMDFKSEARIEIMRAARKEKSYEMNKCLTLVHLTSAFRIHSLCSEESKARDWALNQSTTALLGYL